MSVALPILAIATMVAFNALYVAAEFATVGSRRSRVQETADTGDKAATRLLGILKDPQRLDNYVAACQIGITLSSLVAGAYGQAALTPLLEPVFGTGGQTVAIVVVLITITAVQVVLGELLPKTAALRYPERLAMLTLVPMRVSQRVFKPLVAVFNGSAFAIMGRLRLTVDHSHAHVHSPGELAGLYRASAAGGLIDAAERDMLAGVLNVDRRLAREIMTPRRRLVTVAATATVGEALATVAASPYSRFPVVGDVGDDVIGIVHIRDLFTTARTDPDRPVADIAPGALAVAEVLTVPLLWRWLQDEAQHCAVVVDEYGSVAGMVTLEDALEEILGEVHDEFDDEAEPLVVADGRVSVRGDVLLDVLDRRFELDLAAGATVDTLSGLLWHELGRFPEVGDEVPLGPHEVVVVRVDAVEGTTVARASFELPETAQ